MAVEKLLKFSRSLNAQRHNSLPVLFYSINAVVDWVYWIFGGASGNHLLLNHGGRNFIHSPTEWKSNISSEMILWMAVPKKRTSKKTKWLRHQRRSLKNREDIETCSVCGNAKLVNCLCGTCFERIQRATETVLNDTQSYPGLWRPSVPEYLKRFYRK